MITFTLRHPIRTVLGAGVAVLCAIALWPGAGQAAGKAETLRIFSKDVSLTVTRADGTVIHHPPFPDAKPGDILDVYSLNYVGNHRHHAPRSTSSGHLRCLFGTGEPDCESHVAIDGSLLIFRGNPGTVTGGAGRYLGATGKVLSSKEVKGGSDVVARIQLR